MSSTEVPVEPISRARRLPDRAMAGTYPRCTGFKPTPVHFRTRVRSRHAVRLMTATARQAGLQARGHRYSRTAAVALGLVAVDGVGLLQRERDLVEAFEQAPARLGLEFERHGAAVEAHFERLEVDLAITGRHQRAHLILGQHDRKQADLRAVGEEDVGEAGRDDGPEAVVLQRPRRVLARRAAAEVGPGGEDRVGRQVPVRVLGPVVEQELAEAGPLDPLEELLGDDLVGVDVGAVEHADRARDLLHRIHQLHSRMSTKWPPIAAAAAIWGETRWVRPPRPWRPSKLRLDVEAQRSPGWRMSGFMPRHIEQPAMRQSKPAARNTWSSPSASAWRRTCSEPGTTIASTSAATRRPSTTCAAARRSPIRLFVQEPMNTRSRRMSVIAVPGWSAMYFSARCSVSVLGSGTRSVTGTTWAGVVPHVTSGESAEASTRISLSNVAPSSVRSRRHASTAASKSAGAPGRPSIHSNVVSSGATIPARPPPSIVMLQVVIRPSIESPSMTGPAYSTTWPAAPLVPIWPIVPRIRSLGVTPKPSSPS